MDEKVCTVCKVPKQITAFGKHKNCKNGISSRCRSCTNRYLRELTAKRSPDDLAKALKRRLKKEYGISFEEYMNIIERQSGVCAICGKTPFQISGKMCLDHCHKTGKIRGVLCTLCNTGIGMFNDSEDNLKEAINYLSRARYE